MPMRAIRMHHFWVVFVFVVSSSISSSGAWADDACFRPLCVGAEPIYTGEDGARRGEPFGVCQTDSHAPGGIAHSTVPCPAGTTLVPHAGQCHVNSCDGGSNGSCTFTGVCGTTPGFPTYTGDSFGPGGTLTATCQALSTGLNYLAHTPASCPPGFTLVPHTGVCRRCGSNTSTRALPDLIIKGAWLRTQISPAHVSILRTRKPYLACFNVVNIGSVVSGPFRIGGGGLGVRVAPFQDHASLAPGAERSGCLTYDNAPPPGTYRLELKADSLNSVSESREDNNDAAIDVTVTP